MHLHSHQYHIIKFNSTIIMSSKQLLVLLFGVMLLIITTSCWEDHSEPHHIRVATASLTPQEETQPMFGGKNSSGNECMAVDYKDEGEGEGEGESEGEGGGDGS